MEPSNNHTGCFLINTGTDDLPAGPPPSSYSASDRPLAGQTSSANRCPGEDTPQDDIETRPQTPTFSVSEVLALLHLEDTPFSRKFLSSRVSAVINNIDNLQYRVKLVDSMSNKAIRLNSVLFERLLLDYQWLTKNTPPSVAGELPEVNPFAELEMADVMAEADISRIMVSAPLSSNQSRALTTNF